MFTIVSSMLVAEPKENEAHSIHCASMILDVVGTIAILFLGIYGSRLGLSPTIQHYFVGAGSAVLALFFLMIMLSVKNSACKDSYLIPPEKMPTGSRAGSAKTLAVA